VTREKWAFRHGEQGLGLEPPKGVDPAAEVALWDFAMSDIGNNPRRLSQYRAEWRELSGNPAAAREGLSGNATSQSIDGDDVVLEALSGQWETVRISKEQFEDFLEQFADFLAESGGGS
jgi:hypothetical protein